MTGRRKKPIVKVVQARPRVNLEGIVENTWTKIVTRFGVPALLAVAVWLGQQYWGDFLNEVKLLHAEDAAIRNEVSADRKQSADTNKEIVNTLNGIQQTVGQQQILIQQQYNEVKGDVNEGNHRLEKIEDRLFDGHRSE